MRRQIVTAALALGLLLATAPTAQAREEGIETCVTLSCDVTFVNANGVIARLGSAIQAGCAATGGAAVAPLRICTPQAAGPCSSFVIAAGVDGVAALGARSEGCGDGFDGLILHLAR